MEIITKTLQNRKWWGCIEYFFLSAKRKRYIFYKSAINGVFIMCYFFE
jgi:hypothetical protein